LLAPVIPKIECVESNENFGRFVAEPLEKGFGVTLGNALRRILLGYLPGAAITRMKIEGIHHEFSAIPHVKEDAIEFLLNIKAIRIKSLSGQTGKLTMDIKKEGQIHAADIQPSVDFEIANPELYIATMDSPKAKLYVEFEVELGTGYKEAESSDSLPVGTIPIDSIFTPTRKVNYTIEPTHMGLETSRERLNLEIWTDGTTTPLDALSHSSDILLQQITPFADFATVSQVELEKKAFRLSIPDEKYNMPVEQLDMSVRTINCLRRANISTVGELIALDEDSLRQLRNFGTKSLNEICDRLSGIDLSLVSKDKTSDNEAGESPQPDSGEGTEEN